MKAEWNSRTAGFKLAFILTLYFAVTRFVPPLVGMDWEWTTHITWWWYPIPIWSAFCLVVYLLGRLIKLLFKII